MYFTQINLGNEVYMKKITYNFWQLEFGHIFWRWLTVSIILTQVKYTTGYSQIEIQYLKYFINAINYIHCTIHFMKKMTDLKLIIKV